MVNTTLELLKMDLGISHNERDEYFETLLLSAKTELEAKGIKLNEASVYDNLLISDYAAWLYRKRTENVPLARNLEFRIKNRIIKKRSEGDV